MLKEPLFEAELTYRDVLQRPSCLFDSENDSRTVDGNSDTRTVFQTDGFIWSVNLMNWRD